MSSASTSSPSFSGEAEAHARLLREEQLANARRINLARLWGVSLFFGLFVVLGGILGDAAWQGNLRPFFIYWVATVGLFWAARQWEQVARFSSLSIAFLDMPMVFILQFATYPTTPNRGAVAGYSLGIFIFLLILASLSLEPWKIYVTAAMGALCEGALQALAPVSLGAILSTAFVMGLAAFACAYGGSRVRDLLAEVVRREQEKIRMERLAAIGQLLAGIGHDLRNPLAAVGGAFYFIDKRAEKTGFAEDPEVHRAFRLVDHELKACNRIIGDLLDFARERRLALEPTPLPPLVSEAMSLVRTGSHVSMENLLPEDLPAAAVDPSSFRQVLVNLIQNAADAVPPERPGFVRVSGDVRANQLYLSIADSGQGIAPENLARIFEPLFTTKEKGTGLGLAIVSNLVRQHGGSLDVQSAVGEGATFTVRLALASK